MKIISLAALVLAAAGVSAAPSKLPHETPLIVDGRVVVDAGDFEGNMLRIPEDKRAEFRTSYERIATVVDNMFISRSLAERARQMGLDKDPAVQRRLQQVQDGVLADLYVQKYEKDVAVGNLDQRARELYLADRARYVTPEEVHVQHILVKPTGRTWEDARQRAREAVQKARAGEDFLALATRYSDDPEKAKNGGDLGFSSPGSFVEPVRNAIAGLKKKGDIAGPVESEYGFHVVRLVERKEPKPIPYETVAKRIIEAERERIRKQRVEALVRDVRSSSTVVVHRDNVEKLVTPVEADQVRRAMESAAANPK